MLHGISLGHWSFPYYSDEVWLLNYRTDVGLWNDSIDYTAKGESTMAQIAEVIGRRDSRLEGFTLFKNDKGWQMSVRRQGEHGWDVKIVPDEDAQRVLSMLEANGHPDGPITIRSEAFTITDDLHSALVDAMTTRSHLTVALRAARDGLTVCRLSEDGL